jgi:hypothetical protein
VWVLVGCLVASSCGILDAGSEGADEDLRRARARWARAAIEDYDLVMSRICFCIPVGPVLVSVRGGERVATSVVVDDAEGPLAPNLVPFYPTVDELFDVVADALEAGVYELRVTYHPNVGYPTEVWVDRSPSIADEEFGYEVGLVFPEG